MTHSPDNDALFDFNQIFIARERQLAEFESVLTTWRRIMGQTGLQESSSTDIPSPNNKLQRVIAQNYPMWSREHHARSVVDVRAGPKPPAPSVVAVSPVSPLCP